MNEQNNQHNQNKDSNVPPGFYNADDQNSQGQQLSQPSPFGGGSYSQQPPQTNDQVQYQPQPQVIERVIEREVEKKSFPNPFKPIFFVFGLFGKLRQAILTGCVLIIVAVIAVILIFLFRPPFAWNPMKAFLNGDVKPPAIEDRLLDDVYSEINEQGDLNNRAEIDENDARALFSQKVQPGTDLRVDVEDGLFRLMVNIDTETNPLWLVADVTQKEDALAITKVGFGRIGLPGGINSFLSDQLFGIITLTKQQIAGAKSVALFEIVLSKSELASDLSIENVRFEKDKIVVEFRKKFTEQGF